MQTPTPHPAATSLFLTLLATTLLGPGAPAQRGAPEKASETLTARAVAAEARPGSPLKALAARSSRRDAVALTAGTVQPRSSALYFDAPGDGSIWVRGANYKASFTTEGACVVPFMGARAPANRPVRFIPESASIGGRPLAFEHSVPASRAGSTIAFDRTSFVENYAVGADSMEQTFVFAELAARGELVITLRVHTDLAAEGVTSEGLRFTCEAGGLIYGRATALDARGRTAPIESRFEHGLVELRVPASFVDSATLPLTIDPVISTFAIDTTTLNDHEPDVAYDPSTDRYMVCYEETFSGTDHDVYEELLDSTGAFISGNYMDYTTDNWQHPRIANNARASQFMVVAHIGAAPSRGITSRVASAGLNVPGNQVLVSAPYFAWDQVNPDIGGNPGSDPDSLYLVVWEFAINGGPRRDLVQTGMHTTGLPDGFAATCIDCGDSARTRNPAISKSCGSSSGLHNVWSVVWEYEFSPTDHDIYAAQQANELLIVGPYQVDSSFSDDRRPTVSSFAEGSSAPGNYLVAWDRKFTTEHDIMGQVRNGTSLVAAAGLTSLEGTTFYYQDQLAPSADSDGCTFAVAYEELFGTSPTDWDVYIATFNTVGSTIDCIEPHVNLAYTSLPDVAVRMTAARGGPMLRYMGTWMQEVAGNSDIHGGLFDYSQIVSYCQPGSEGVAICPCNNPSQGGGGCNNSVGTGGAVLSATGTPSLSADTLSLAQSGELPNALSIFLQGTATVTGGTTFGDGVRCAGGTLKRLFVHNASSGSVTAPVGADSAVNSRSAALGDTILACQTRYYQIYYRDANLTFCAGGFNVGNGAKVTWLP